MARASGSSTKGVRPGRHGGLEIRWRENGKNRSATLHMPDNAAGRAKAAAIRADKRRQKHSGGVSDETFAQATQRFLDGSGLKLSTLATYTASLNVYWRPAIGHLRMAAIRRGDLRTYHETAWTSASTKHTALTALRKVFAMWYEDNQETGNKNPAELLHYAQRQEPEVDPFSAAERDAILGHLSGVPHAYFGVAFETGARTSELLALQWTHVDSAAGTIAIDRARVHGRLVMTTKTNKQRRVLLTERAIAYLKAIEPTPPDPRPLHWTKGYVFCKADRSPFTTSEILNRHFAKACAAAGVRFRRGYNARHTRASLGVMAGQKPAWLAKQLGHSIQTLLHVYAKWIDGPEDVNELRKLEGA